MEKIDLARKLKPLYAPPKDQLVIVDVPKIDFLMIDGSGDPNTAPAYREALEALYALAYTIKFSLKLGPAKTDFRVMPLEGLWWSDDLEVFRLGRRDDWNWRMMIAMPDIVTADIVKDAKAAAEKKKDLPALSNIRFKPFAEGKAAQTLYIGPYAEEGPTIEALHAYIARQGHKLSGRHHEIYMSDPRRTAPAKLRTIIRQPFV
jgi:hypothetical protein